MKNLVRCQCGKLSIELNGRPVSSNSFGRTLDSAELKQLQDKYTYFRNKDVIETTGENTCTSFIHNSGWQLNSYHCCECSSALYCVLTEKKSLIGVASEYLSSHTEDAHNRLQKTA